MLALLAAGRRGIETTLVLPARNDSRFVAAASRSFYEVMHDANVSIMEFTGGLLHAKTITIDRALAIVSTANLDRRSFELNFEVSMVVYDSNFASELRFLQKTYMNSATQVEPADWQHRKWTSKLAQNAAGLLSPLL
jgi:cardiolipin synthase